MTNSIEPDLFKIHEKQNEKKRKKKKIYLPYLSHDHSQERKCEPQSELKATLNEGIKIRKNEKSSEKRIPTLSADRSVDSKIKLKVNTKSMIRVDKSKNLRLNYEKIKKDIE